MPQGSRASRHKTCGRMRKAKGVTRAKKLKQPPRAGPTKRLHSRGVDSSKSLVRRVRSSLEILCSEVPVTTVVVSPQLSSCQTRRKMVSLKKTYRISPHEDMEMKKYKLI